MLAHTDTGDGPSLVFLHGLGADRTRWAPFVDRLSGTFRCTTVDLPGHGESPADGCNAVEGAIAVQELIGHLGIEAPTIVGHSLGATIALVHAAVFGPRSIVAFDPVGLYLPDLAAGLAPYADRLRGDDFDAAFGEWEAELLAPVPEQQRAGLRAAIHPSRVRGRRLRHRRPRPGDPRRPAQRQRRRRPPHHGLRHRRGGRGRHPLPAPPRP